jgi:hypothetical protein
MKKLIAVVMLPVVLAVLFAACADNNNYPDNTGATDGLLPSITANPTIPGGPAVSPGVTGPPDVTVDPNGKAIP